MQEKIKVPPASARVVIIGGGVIGCSVAYHLAKLGCTDVVLLERKKLTSGTTWHAAGLLTTLRATENQTRLAKYTQQLYKSLEAETEQNVGFINCGSIQIASTAERVEEMRRGCAMARIFGVENHEITPQEIQKLWPMASVADIRAGFYFPDDGRINPTDVTQALARGARRKGVQIFENTKVTGVRIENGRATGVATDAGPIECEYVVNCAGMWARQVGRMAGVDVPLLAAEHYYLITESIEGLHNKLPILRDPGNAAYYREEAGKLMLGLFEPVARPWGQDGIPEEFCFDELAPDWDRMAPYIDQAMSRIPGMRDIGIRKFFCGPESFTPDHNYLIGEAPNVKNFFVAAGFNSLGILSGGGAGMVIAEWIMKGTPPLDVWDVSLQRTQPFHNNARYLNDRIVESLGIGYQYHWPFRQWESARDVKRLVLHERLLAVGACMGESAGWERPNWYASGGMSARYEYSYGRQNWFPFNAAEHRAVRENVGIFEQSSFSKFLVQGRDAERLLNRISTSNLSVPDGRVVYTQWLNVKAGIEADLTVTRLDRKTYLVVAPAFTHTHIQAWLKKHIGADEFCVITDVTGAYGMLNLQGPNSRQLLSQLTADDVSNPAFPFGTMQRLDIGYHRVMALRVSYTGELGWELYIPTEYMARVYEMLVAEGARFDLKHCGYHTLNSLRIEKAYREWAHDIGADDSPLQAGLAFTCDWEKPDGFIGREALLKEREAGVPKRRLVQFLLHDRDPILHHNEPILLNGNRVGHTTSAMYGHTLDACVALGYVEAEAGVDKAFLQSGTFAIELGCRLFEATASLTPLYVPSNERSWSCTMR